MATHLHPLSNYDVEAVPDASNMEFVILVSEWNSEITSSLSSACVETLLKHGAQENKISVQTVPGSFELSTAAKWAAQVSWRRAVICLGCVVQGETRHFDFICNAVANGLTQVAIETENPVIFGLLTTNNQQQAIDRSGGKYGNKGVEAAIAAIKMLALQKNLQTHK
ncbi:MAG: 6,7-dimethyl-8-ribityllumazine synthase [Bacteroidales bacterium]